MLTHYCSLGDITILIEPTTCIITWDGLVLPCCFDKDVEYLMGDLKNKTTKEVWQIKPDQEFRKLLTNARAEIKMCKTAPNERRFWDEGGAVMGLINK